MKVLQKCFDRVISSWKWKEVFFRVVLVISSRKCNPNYIDVTYKCWYVVVVCAQTSNMCACFTLQVYIVTERAAKIHLAQHVGIHI